MLYSFVIILLYPLALLRPRFIVPVLLVHGSFIAASAVQYGRIPLVGLHDTLSFLAFSTGAVYAVVSWNRRRDPLSFIIVALILFFLAGSLMSQPTTGPLSPVLRTLWFELHVVLSFIAYALFGVGAAFAVLRLRGDGVADRDEYRLLLIGYVLFTAAMVFGGIWAYLAWGTYWLWTPKELWTSIVWIVYGLYLHARLVRGWSGRVSAWIAIAGFVIVLFTYAGVGLLMKSSHEF
jgi:ABC-type transport system involved in cytochrome c biogenesis permease subunit